MIKVATVILTYNSKDYIKPCLEALFSSKGNYELSVIIVDNNSPDDTGLVIENLLKRFKPSFFNPPAKFFKVQPPESAEIQKVNKEAKSHKIIKFIQNKENNGFASGINIGLKEAKKGNPDYIFLLNPDTKIQPNSIALLLNEFKNYELNVKNAKVGVIGAQMIYLNKMPQGTFGNFPSFFTEILQKTRLYKVFPFGRFIPYNFFTKRYFNKVSSVDWVSGGAMMIKREVIEKIGFFDENYFMYIEDIDFCRRVREADFEIIYNPKAKIWHKLSASTESAQTTNKLQITNFINKIIKKIKNPTKIWQKESLAYYFKKWKSGLPEVVCRSTKYHLEPAGYTKIKFILNSIKTFLNLQLESLRVLDIGCGNGNISFALAALKCNVTGVDINDDLVERLKRKSKNLGISHLNFLKVDANNLNSLSDGKFDVIIMSEVLEHLKNPLKTLQDAKALLKEKGFIIITIPNKFSLEEKLRQLINKSNFLIKLKNKLKSKINTQIQSSHDTPHLHFFSYNDFAKVVQKAGLYIKNAKAQSAGFKSFYYLLGKFVLSRKSPLFHILDQIDGFLAQFIPAHFGDGMMFVISKSHSKLDDKYH